MKTTTMKLNVLSNVGRPRSVVRPSPLNMDALRMTAGGRGRPLGSKNRTETKRGRGRPNKAESIKIMFERIEHMIMTA